ncbi:hypothetical protein C7271_21180 [filamentous cyanobacterium CCP5]|nr:hypothetical protein C7271_21180 [filamentous cyanobacterium CCP5]
MSHQNSYETLGLTEGSSFDEIQEARDRLLQECEGDRQQSEAIETAYDAILMERLRLRQEGKIKVPDRIRFAENVSEPPPAPVAPSLSRPEWLINLTDTPDRNDVLWPALIYGVLGVAGFYASASLILALASGASVYFLNRKENRFWRSVLLSFLGLLAGLGVGLSLGQLLIPQGVELAWATSEAIATLITCFVLWLISSFLR